MSELLAAGSLAFAGGSGLIAGLASLRRVRYRKMLNYNPKQDFISGVGGPGVETLPVLCDKDGLVLPRLAPSITGALLQLDVRASAAGQFLDPVLEITTGGVRETQVLDRGACGKRFFNVTRILAAGQTSGLKLRLRGKHLFWDAASVHLHLSCEEISPDDRLLIISPHPDDAEIAAYGLYADKGATIVTLTAGDNSDRYQRLGHGNRIGLSRQNVAKVRVWDSITIPRLAGVSPEHAVNLAFPDGRLAEMQSSPEKDFRGERGTALDFEALRGMNQSPLVRAASNCSWASLIEDLRHIFSIVRPTIIVTPHPALDPHEDHAATTAAVFEALSLSDFPNGRFFFFCVHNRRTELWPFGAAGSGVAHLPLLAQDGEQPARFYSHSLTPERQAEKYLALEAMHDIRQMEEPVIPGMSHAAKRIRAELRGLFDGLGSEPTSYLRRAVRPDEPFFVVDFDARSNFVFPNAGLRNAIP